VKERFASSKPKNFSDDFLLTTLTYMLEKPDVQAHVWKNQKSVHGLAKVKSWRLLESCGVHIITFTTTQMILLVERRFPQTRFTLDQMLNNVRLEVEEESEVSLELLRFVRSQRTYNGKPLYKTDSMGIAHSDSEVEEVSNETTGYMASTSLKSGSDIGYGTNSLLEQLRETKRDDECEPYDDDLYESHDMSKNFQVICGDFDIMVRGWKKKHIDFDVC
nr:hypothetical protein [Tanacetum cinerariifolium]